MESEVVVDTSALFEYVYGTDKGATVKNIIEEKQNLVLIPSIVIAELTSKLVRCEIENIDKILNNLEAYSLFLPLDGPTCIRSGKRHANLKKLEKNISIIDCIIMETAEEHGGALIVTCDNHFKHYKHSKII